MVTAEECRIQSEAYTKEAHSEYHVAVRTAFFGMARSWNSLANQTDRLVELRDERILPV
jgi:hypothetical protein